MKPLSITTKRMLRRAVAAFCACACVFAVSACGADETGKIRIGIKFDQPGLGFKKNGTYVGFDVDVAKYVAKKLGYSEDEIVWKESPSKQREAMLQNGDVDYIVASYSITDERKASGWTFSDGYYDATQTMTVAEDSDITGFADLNGQTVAVKTGTQGATYAESLKDEYGFNITYFEDSPTMYQAVLGGQCVACFEDTPIMKASIKDGGLALKVLDDTASDPAPYGFAIFSADSQELLDMFNAGLADIKANGKYDEILAKYLG